MSANHDDPHLRTNTNPEIVRANHNEVVRRVRHPAYGDNLLLLLGSIMLGAILIGLASRFFF